VAKQKAGKILGAVATPFVELADAVAVVTGAGSGIGRGVVRALARRGSRVAVTDIRVERAKAVAAEIQASGGTAIAVGCDVSSLAEIEGVRDACLEAFGRVDVVMNNVGVLAVGPPESIPIEEWQRIIDINLMGVVRSNAVFLPLLLAQSRGHVVNTASVAGLFPYGFDRLPYTTTKHAIVGLSESLALYLRPHGIGVSCLCPAGVMTNIAEQIRFFGESSSLRSPDFPILSAEAAGELVVDGIAEGRFLLLTAPKEVQAELLRKAQNPDAYLFEQADPEGETVSLRVITSQLGPN
jgi:NAD(P)-dependent dehydrogenase (short-subunit alcohol dehydrogenase family)